MEVGLRVMGTLQVGQGFGTGGEPAMVGGTVSPVCTAPMSHGAAEGDMSPRWSVVGHRVTFDPFTVMLVPVGMAPMALLPVVGIIV